MQKKYSPAEIKEKGLSSASSVAKAMDDKKASKEQAKRYNPSLIEKKWQDVWDKEEIYKFEPEPEKQTYYPLVELPYPSGDLHIGHWFSFATADVHARVHRMKGKNVFFTNGFDAFGLPAENAAIKRGLHPQDWTLSNIASMKKQFVTMGSMIDWSHETITCLPEYYKWNQWIFTRLYEKGLAYRGKMLGNWCPVDQTVLANEHVENGKCWRCGNEVVQKEIEQWFIRLTDFADALIWPNLIQSSVSSHQSLTKDKRQATSDQIDWPVSVKVAQNQWIGRREGIEIIFDVIATTAPRNDGLTITVFTTTPINFGATFLVIAPEHPIVEKITTPEQKEAVQKYVEEAKKETQMDRLLDAKDKTGVFTGAYVLNHLTGEKMPVWVADYVLMNYGTGAVQGCPGHDERDFDFAKKFGIPIPRVVTGPNGEIGPIVDQAEQVHAGERAGKMINSGFFDGLEFTEAMKKTMDYFEEKGWGKRSVTYHIHDWSISRQRYWGTPVPMIHCKKDGIVPVPDDQLPVVLPYDVDFTPKGEPPLASNKEWLNTTCPKCGGEATRDAETLDTFFDSSWYFWRYLNPRYNEAPFDKLRAEKMMPVDIYFGGAEHTLGHTLYARFFTKFFKLLGLTDLEEFALKRVQHGVILGPDGNRMSKSKGNVINPDDVVREYGADATRTYLCFMMPYDATAPWDPNGMWGVYRFLKRVWDLQDNVLNDQVSITNDQLTRKDRVIMNKTMKKVGEDAGATKFNTAVAELMKWLNHLEGKEVVSSEEYKNLLLVLAPFAPHISEELFQQFFANSKSQETNFKFESVHQQSWPVVDEEFLLEDITTVVVQVNGKMRGSVEIPTADIENKEKVIAEAQSRENIVRHLDGKSAKNVIYVPGKILNFVVV